LTPYPTKTRSLPSSRTCGRAVRVPTTMSVPNFSSRVLPATSSFIATFSSALVSTIGTVWK
jgi:hypothetical protein